MLRLITSAEPGSMLRKRKLLQEMEQIYQETYLSICDHSIPLHHITAIVAAITLHRVRFMCFHPRNQPDGARNMSQADGDSVFESAVKLLQLDLDMRDTNFSMHLLDHMMSRTQVEVLVYMVSELRRRVRGELVRDAWAALERMHIEHPELSQDDRKFFTSLADLTLEAWQARWREIEPQGESVLDLLRYYR